MICGTIVCMTVRGLPDHHESANTVYAASLQIRPASGATADSTANGVADLVIYLQGSGQIVARRSYSSMGELEAAMQEVVTDLERLFPDEFANAWVLSGHEA